MPMGAPRVLTVTIAIRRAPEFEPSPLTHDRVTVGVVQSASVPTSSGPRVDPQARPGDLSTMPADGHWM